MDRGGALVRGEADNVVFLGCVLYGVGVFGRVGVLRSTLWIRVAAGGGDSHSEVSFQEVCSDFFVCC